LAQIERYNRLADFIKDVDALLREKEELHGISGGFYETNADRDYTHAIGEAKLKLNEFVKTGNPRMLLKATGWIFLIYETERKLGPVKD